MPVLDRSRAGSRSGRQPVPLSKWLSAGRRKVKYGNRRRASRSDVGARRSGRPLRERTAGLKVQGEVAHTADPARLSPRRRPRRPDPARSRSRKPCSERGRGDVRHPDQHPGGSDAVEKGKEQGCDLQQYPQGDEGWKTCASGCRDCSEQGREVQEGQEEGLLTATVGTGGSQCSHHRLSLLHVVEPTLCRGVRDPKRLRGFLYAP